MYELVTSEDIRKLRLQVELTQVELARKAGVSQSLIARIEAGDIDPRLSTLRKILDTLKEVEIAKESEKKKKLLAKDIMKSPVIYASPMDTIRKASKLMEENDISQLPVLENGLQVGSISETHVIKEMTSEKDMSNLSSRKVKEIMVEGFPTVGKNTDIEVISNLVKANPAVLVVEKGRAVGIITKTDVIKLLRR